MSDLAGLAADLTKAALSVQMNASTVVAQSAAELERIAKQVAPRRTGALAGSISASVALGGLSADVGPTEYYGQFVEYGTSKMAPQPFMGPALDQVTPGFLAAMEALGGDVL